MKTLCIAVDARPLCLPMVGITRYTHELLSRLVHSPHEWFLYLDRKPVHDIPDLPNVHIRFGSMARSSTSTLFAQLKFSVWARQDDIDIFWSPRHHLPLLLPKRVKKVLTIHDMVWQKYPNTMTRAGLWVERLFMPASIKRAHSIITVSKATQDDVLDFSPGSAHKITAIHSGLSQPAEPDSDARVIEHPYFLFVGTLEPRKNLKRLLRAFSIVCKSDSTVMLVIAGAQGWGKDNLPDLIAKLKLCKRVLLVGHAKDSELSVLYREARALVMPSLYEGFGLPLVEAMGHGTPAITSNCGAMAEVAGEAGLLVNPESETDIGGAMLKMLDVDARDEYAIRAQKRALLFSWDEAAQKVLDVIEKVDTGCC